MKLIILTNIVYTFFHHNYTHMIITYMYCKHIIYNKKRERILFYIIINFTIEFVICAVHESTPAIPSISISALMPNLELSFSLGSITGNDELNSWKIYLNSPLSIQVKSMIFAFTCLSIVEFCIWNHRRRIFYVSPRCLASIVGDSLGPTWTALLARFHFRLGKWGIPWIARPGYSRNSTYR